MSHTVGQLLHDATRRLTMAGVDSARLDARLLLSHVLQSPATRLFTHPETPVTEADTQRFLDGVERRAQRRPLSHIIGQRGFWTLSLTVTPDTLDPRPDTETLVELVLQRIGDRQAPLRLVDFGTGSGAILLALLSELPNASGLAVDKSPAALEVARLNAQANGLADRMICQLADWGQGIHGDFDVAVSNPPYIPAAQMAELEPEVRDYEPRLALVGGDDGLDCYRVLLPDMARLLVPGGLAVVEHGQGQSTAVADLFRAAGLDRVTCHDDLAGIDRCVVGFRPK